MSGTTSFFTKKRVETIKSLGSLAALIIMIIVMSIAQPQFRSLNNILTLLRQASVNGLIAFGMTCVILTGCIDLSVGSTLGLTAMLCAGFLRDGMSEHLALPLILLIGTCFGLVNGVLVAKGRLQPFIATLITMSVYRGFTLILSGGKPISKFGDQPMLNGLGKGFFLQIPIPVWILFLMFCVFFFVLNMTTFGRRVYAVGSNDVAAKIAGVSIARTKIIVYSISGLMATMAGLILLSRLGSAQPTLGEGFETDAIAATVLGGTSMSGGRGRVYGTVIGILIIAILSNGLNVMGVSSYYQDVVKGIVILIAVLSDPNR